MSTFEEGTELEVVTARRRGRVAVSAGKKDLVDLVATELESTKADAELIVEAVGRAIARLASRRKLVRVPHLGSFRVIDVVPREGRNPRTGEPVPIARGARVAFRASREFKGEISRRAGRA